MLKYDQSKRWIIALKGSKQQKDEKEKDETKWKTLVKRPDFMFLFFKSRQHSDDWVENCHFTVEAKAGVLLPFHQILNGKAFKIIAGTSYDDPAIHLFISVAWLLSTTFLLWLCQPRRLYLTRCSSCICYVLKHILWLTHCSKWIQSSDSNEHSS